MPDNTLPTAQNLGNLTSTVTIADAVNSTDTVDFYSFSLNGTSDVNIALTGLSADANIRLIQDTNGNGVVDTGEVIVSSAFTGTNPDSINVNNLGAGTYFVAVDRVGNNNTNYTLRLSPFGPSNLLAQEENLGNLSTTPVVRQGFVGDFDTSDIYRFSLANASDINLTLTGLTADADVRIIRDANNNGVVDLNEVVAFSTSGSTTPEVINLNNQAAGTYFAQVYQFNGNTNYSLRLSNSDPSNLIFSEENFGNLGFMTPVTRVNSVGNTDTSDFYTFSLDNPGNINLALTGLSANANIRLIRDANGNGVVDAGEVIASSTNGGTAFDSINLHNQAAGTYIAQVFQSGNSNTNYTFQVSYTGPNPSNLLVPEANLGNLSTTPVTRTGFVGNADTSDIYRFNLASASDINIGLTGLSPNAQVRLIRDANNDGVGDFGEVIGSSFWSGTTPSINLSNQAAGNYFVQVYQFHDNTNTNYTLRLSNASISNLLAEEENLGTLSNTPTARFDSVGDLDTSNVYRFNLSSPGDINVSLTPFSADADLRLIRDANNNGIVDNGEVIATSTAAGTANDSINLNNQAAGNYFVQVYQFSGNTDYFLRLSNSIHSNLIAEESNLGNLPFSPPITLGGSVGDTDTSDIYRFNLETVRDINIALTGLTADADLRLIRDGNNNSVVDAGEVVALSGNGGTTDDTINLNDQAAGNYFVQVYQYSGDTNYSLRLDAFQPSNVIGVQENFGVLTAGGSGITRNDFVGNSDTSDIYRFSLDSIRNVTASISGLAADADLRLLQDINSNGIIDSGEEIVRSSFGGTTTDSINRVLGAGDYFLQAYQYGGLGGNGDTNYTLAVNAL